MSVLITVLFWFLLILAVITIPFNLPGNVIILVLKFLHSWLIADHINWKVIGILAGIAAVSELLEFFVTVKSTKYFGGSKNSMIASIIGSIIGAFVGSSFLLLIGTLLGAMVGAFVGSFMIDYYENKDYNRAMKTGMGAFTGVAGGKLSKILLAVIMLIIIALY
ncbi:MAG: DUF456 domain-containing protein [Candidatus Marinimicrobia bacterium]|nr:DUF456 domain-containing protein [Candidatus Neomarinimicrobiota bacterium]